MKETAKDLKDAIASGDLPEVDPTADEFDAEGVRFHGGARLNVPLESIFGEEQDMGIVEATLRGEEGALLLPSDHHPEALSPRWDGNPANEHRENNIRYAAQAAATMSNPRTRQRLDPMSAAHLKTILDGMADLPNPDVTTWIGNKRVTIPGDVTSTPNKLDRNKSMKQLSRILGGECKGDKRHKDGSIEYCVCPTHRVARSAQQWGFRDKPLLWLSQQLAQLMAPSTTWKEIPADGAYDASIDEDMESERSIPKALAMLVSMSNVERMVDHCRQRTSLLSAFRYFVTRACDHSDEVKKPKEYTHQFDV